MKSASLDRSVQQSLLDRLIDLDPKTTTEAPLSWTRSVQQLKASLRRDLESLLNTRRIPTPAPEAFEELPHSLYYFGFPDITSMGRDSKDVRVRLMRQVEETIATFEPRLAAVKVSLAETDDEGRRQLRFLIEGLLRMEPNPEQVVFDTVLEISSGEYHVKGDASA
jgi:type VI secretion system protein ImpF